MLNVFVDFIVGARNGRGAVGEAAVSDVGEGLRTSLTFDTAPNVADFLAFVLESQIVHRILLITGDFA